jgi:hypothetical protein
LIELIASIATTIGHFLLHSEGGRSRLVVERPLGDFISFGCDRVWPAIVGTPAFLPLVGQVLKPVLVDGLLFKESTVDVFVLGGGEEEVDSTGKVIEANAVQV